MKATIRVLLVAVFLAPTARVLRAQDEDRAPSAPGAGSVVTPVPWSQVQFALGSHVGGPIDVQTPLGWNRMLGCARAWGYYWVSGGAGTAGPFAIAQFDLSGNLLQTFTQDVTGAATQWGVRDLAADEANFKLWGGMEGARLKEYSFNPNAGPYGTLSFVTTYTVPITGAPILRALARNPNTGTFYSKNFTTDLWEFSIAGGTPTLVNTYTVNGKATYGLAWDTLNDTLWQFDQNSPTGGVPGCAPTVGGPGDMVEFNEVDPLSGSLTGRTFVGVTYGVTCTNIAGGCDIFDDGSGFLKIVALHQNNTDELNVYELDFIAPPPSTYCTSASTSNGCHPAMTFSGTPSASATSGFTVTCNQVEGQKQGIQFYGISGQVALPWASGSTSFLCVKLPTQRMPVQGAGGTINQCNGSISTDFLAFVAANPGVLGTPLSAGHSFDAQTWFRDPPAPKTTNLSNGLHFTLLP